MSRFRMGIDRKSAQDSCASAIREQGIASCDEKAMVGSPECAVVAVIQSIKSGNHGPCPMTAKMIPRGAP